MNDPVNGSVNGPLTKRPRRLRRRPAIRALVRETDLNPRQLVAPLFLIPGKGQRKPIGSMPGVFQTSVDEAVRDAAAWQERGVGGVILFGVPDQKDAEGSGSYQENGLVQEALSRLADSTPDLVRIADICLCEYTSHGHCGVLRDQEVDNDATLPILARAAVSAAKAGADFVAPSDMMDGRVAAIRKGLDAAGHKETAILSYAVKYASSFYGPFRDAAQSTPTFGDRRSYQMDPANGREALREAALDLEEGADLLMVKPAAYSLDIVRQLRDRFEVPVAAYQVSGEVAMIRMAAAQGALNEEAAMMESLVSIRRAGATVIVTYFAAAAAALLEG